MASDKEFDASVRGLLAPRVPDLSVLRNLGILSQSLTPRVNWQRRAVHDIASSTGKLKESSRKERLGGRRRRKDSTS
jgi:hypothetical protein